MRKKKEEKPLKVNADFHTVMKVILDAANEAEYPPPKTRGKRIRKKKADK